jgi:hypothetical protein
MVLSFEAGVEGLRWKIAGILPPSREGGVSACEDRAGLVP